MIFCVSVMLSCIQGDLLRETYSLSQFAWLSIAGGGERLGHKWCAQFLNWFFFYGTWLQGLQRQISQTQSDVQTPWQLFSSVCFSSVECMCVCIFVCMLHTYAYCLLCTCYVLPSYICAVVFMLHTPWNQLYLLWHTHFFPGSPKPHSVSTKKWKEEQFLPLRAALFFAQNHILRS